MNSKKHLRLLQIMHIAMLAGQVLFLVVALRMSSNGEAGKDGASLLPLFWILVPIVGLLSQIGGRLIFRKQLEQIHGLDLAKKMEKHRVASVIKLAMMEAGGILAILGVFFTGNGVLIVLACAMLVLFLFQMPNHLRLLEELQATDEDRKELEREESTQG